MCRSARCSTDPGYVLLSGMAIAETDAAEANNLLKRSSRNEINITPGDFFGEHTMLWGFRRRMNVRTLTKTVVGKMKRDVYFNVVTRSAMHERSKREKYLRTGVPMFETFDDECIAKIADIMEKRSFRPGENCSARRWRLRVLHRIERGMRSFHSSCKGWLWWIRRTPRKILQ